MITVQSIVDSCLSLLLATDSDRYIFDHTFKPAINNSVRWTIALYDRLFSMKKISEFSLSELHILMAYQSSIYSRVAIHKDIWSVTGVHPVITIDRDTGLRSGNQSRERPDVTVTDIVKSATRLTVEQWAKRSSNPLMPGNTLITNPDLIEYGYLGPMQMAGDVYEPGTDTYDREIQISPVRNRQYVALSYLKYPTQVSSLSDTLPFPPALEEIIVKKVLQFIAILENNDDASLYQVTTQEIQNAINVLT